VGDLQTGADQPIAGLERLNGGTEQLAGGLKGAMTVPVGSNTVSND